VNKNDRNLALITLLFLFGVGSAAGHATWRNAAPRAPTARLCAAGQDSDPETVLSTFRPRAGRDRELLETMNLNWSTLRKLGLVLPTPHLILRGTDEEGKTIFVEILTWRDHETPDHVPPEVQTIWNKVETLVENRGTHRGIEFPEFEIVSATP
jgi:hypothetical protein